MLFRRVPLFAAPWTVAHQASLSMGFPRREYWSELPGPSPGDLPDPGIEPVSPALASGFFPAESPGKPLICVILAQLLCKLGINISILYMRKCLKESVQLSLSQESCRLKNLDPCLSSLLFHNPVVFSSPPPAQGAVALLAGIFHYHRLGEGEPLGMRLNTLQCVRKPFPTHRIAQPQAPTVPRSRNPHLVSLH